MHKMILILNNYNINVNTYLITVQADTRDAPRESNE